MTALLDRDDLIGGLREVVMRAHRAGITGARIHIVGGAALRLAYFDRDATPDIDARIEPLENLRPIIEEVAAERGWLPNWLNDDAAKFIPSYGKTVDWRPLYDDESVSVWVAPLDVLLAMKLKAMEGRRGRDEIDVAQLLVLNRIQSAVEAEAILEDYFPGDALNDRAYELLGRFLANPPPERQVPPPIDLS